MRIEEKSPKKHGAMNDAPGTGRMDGIDGGKATGGAKNLLGGQEQRCCGECYCRSAWRNVPLSIVVLFWVDYLA